MVSSDALDEVMRNSDLYANKNALKVASSFPGEQALGQTLISNDGNIWKITGVYENIESNKTSILILSSRW
jgi:hypothetical protein